MKVTDAHRACAQVLVREESAKDRFGFVQLGYLAAQRHRAAEILAVHFPDNQKEKDQFVQEVRDILETFQVEDERVLTVELVAELISRADVLLQKKCDST